MKVVRKKTAARKAVVRERKLAEPLAPNRLPEAPLPKAAPTSAPLPCWSRTRPMMMSATMTSTTRISVNQKSMCVPFRSTFPGDSLAAGRRADRNEIFRHQRRSADQSSVDVGHREQLGRVCRLDAAPVEDGQIPESPVVRREARAGEGVHVLRLLRGGVSARPDRPYGFVREHRIPEGGRARRADHRVELASHDSLRFAALALLQGLSHAQNRRQA